MTPDAVLLDACVVIDYLRQQQNALTFVDALAESPYLPTLVISEVYAGIREGRERLHFESLISGCQVVPLTAEVATTGGLLARQYRPSHGISLFDALIAATTLSLGISLVTCNLKHFPMLTNVIKPY